MSDVVLNSSRPGLTMDSMASLPRLVLVDGHSLAFRAYYAFATSRQGPLRTTTGIPTSICFGFLNSVLQVIAAQRPQYLAIAFDRPEPTFRHQADANYKADRKETPEDFFPDLKNLQRLLEALNIPQFTAIGYEADDVLATLAQQGSQLGCEVKILSGDRDLFQLVDDQQRISVLYLGRNSVRGNAQQYPEFDPAAVAVKLGVKPDQVVDYKALCGDQSDNIPGIRGIGEKTAVKLLQEYGTLASVYDHLDQIKGAVKKKLEMGKKDAEHSQFLAQIVMDAPIELSLETCQLKGFDPDKLQPLLTEFELKSFFNKIHQLQLDLGGEIDPNLQKKWTQFMPSIAPEKTPISPDKSGQLSLFQSNNDQPNPVATSSPSPVPIPVTMMLKPEVIDTAEKLSALVEQLKSYTDPDHPVAWDTETTALDPREADLVGLGCCWGDEPTAVIYIPTGHRDGKQLAKAQVLEALKPILENDRYPKSLQNAKFDRAILWHQGIQLSGVVFDTMLASYVLHPELTHSLGDLCDRYLSGIKSLSFKELGIGKGQTIADLDIPTVADYCGLDAFATFQLVTKLQEELGHFPDLHQLLRKVEQPLEIVLATMEEAGIRIDTNYLQMFSGQLEKDLRSLETRAYADAGTEFNLGSPKQLSEVLFETLGLNRKKSRKTKTGYSTDHTTLEKLQGDHPVIDRILEYRTLAKLKSTYVDALPNLVHPQTKRVHTDFNQAVTTTGRLSSSNPNLQNIPIRTAFSRQIRQAFIPQEGWLLAAADYSQIELRILAHLSQEPVLIEAYQTGQDVHRVTAQLIFDKEDITSEERGLGKTINFGVIYGMGAQRFARESGLSAAQGKAFIDKYRAQYAQVFAYLERMKKAAIAQGFVTTLMGRRRYFNFVSDSLRQRRGSNPEALELEQLKFTYGDSQLLRAAANAPIQGSSADIIKVAMIRLHRILADYQAQLLLQVHDELVFEIPPEEWESLRTIIQSEMETAVELSVPLVVDVRAGKNWMEAK